MYTLPETNSSPPENRPLEKEIPIGMLVLGRVHRLDLNCGYNPTSCFFFLGCLFAYLFQKQFSIFVKTNSRRKSWREIPGPKFDSIVFQFHLGIPVFIYTYVAYIIYTCIRSINIQYIICIIFAGIDLSLYIYIYIYLFYMFTSPLPEATFKNTAMVCWFVATQAPWDGMHPQRLGNSDFQGKNPMLQVSCKTMT